MRVTCPSCGAVYEVPDDAIPDEGRDVQCTNCGHGWFLLHPAAAAAATAPARPPRPAPPPVAEPRPATEPSAITGAGGETVATEPRDDEAAREEEPAPAPRRPPVDPRTRRILREEAEREAEARRSGRRRPRAVEEAVTGGDRPERARPLRRPSRDADAIEPPSEAEAGLSPATRRGPADEPGDGRRGGGGFALGFGATLTLAALLAAAYLFHEAVVEAAPGLAEPMAAYVAWVDQARLAVNAAARAASTRLGALLPGPTLGG